ncbi:hypothetical protein MTR_8g098685 [Medicago truncatula]|uniref:Uncharacterized protein n=1 Tax=Medicago truncatula TaxID=3880 RepID=A0A072TU90_MEDTR|nr:hypothetical protein MTR_8g098685 [Medicago truncatula]
MIPKDLAKKLEFLLLGNAPNPIHGEILNIDNKDSNISEITAQELTFKGTSLTKRNKNDGIEVTSEEFELQGAFHHQRGVVGDDGLYIFENPYYYPQICG